MKTRVRLKKKLLKSLGAKIKEIRTAKGITQEELAALIDSDRSYIGAIEQGRKSPSIYCLYVISNVLNVDLSEITKLEVETK